MSAAEKALSAPALGVGFLAGVGVRLTRGLVWAALTLPGLALGVAVGAIWRGARLAAAAFVEGYRLGAGIDG